MNVTSHLFPTNVLWVNGTEQDNSDHAIANTIWIYIPPFLILLGTFGNVLTIVILCRKPMWKLASSPYLVVLSFADITVLFSGLLRQWIISLKGVDIRLISAALCKIHTTFVYTNVDFSVWLLVNVSVERFICVCFPFKARRICNRGRAKITIAVLLLLLFLINCHFLFGLGSVFDEKSGELMSHCGILNDNYGTFRVNVWPWIDLSVFSLIPFTIIILCNICLITKISRSWRRNKVFSNDGPNVSRTKPTSMTVLLVSLNTLFLFTTCPISIYLLLNPPRSATATVDEQTRLGVWWAIVNQLMYLNSSINFIFYFLSSTKFRQELKAMLRRRNTGIPTMTVPPPQQPPVKPSATQQPLTKQPVPPHSMIPPAIHIKHNT